MGFTRAFIYLIAPERRKLLLLCTYGHVDPAPSASVALRRCPLALVLMRRRRAIHHPDARRNRGRPSCWSPWGGVTSVFGAPLRARGRMIGTLCADRNGERFDMSPGEIEMATVLSALLADVIDGSVERQATAKRHRQMILLSKASQAIGIEEKLSALLSRLARIVRSRTGCLGVVIRLHDERARALRVVAAAGPGARAFLGQICPTSRGRGSLSPGVLSFLADRPIVLNRGAPLPPAESYWSDVRSAMLIPIRIRKRAIGVLRLEATRRFTFDEGDVKVFSVLGEQIGYAVSRALVLEALHKKQAELRAVSESLEASLEADRRRIARELHDELAQSMTAAKLNLGLLEDVTGGSGRADGRRLIHETAALLDRTIAETRRISMDLRPAMLDELGLLPALRWYAGVFAGRTGIRVALRARAAEARIRRELETLLYRFVQEALTNVVRHAQARRVQISLTGGGGRMRAVVWDDGVGMTPARPRRNGLGLLGMRERVERAGGSLRIHSKPGFGTRLEAEIPILPAAVARGLLTPLHGAVS